MLRAYPFYFIQKDKGDSQGLLHVLFMRYIYNQKLSILNKYCNFAQLIRYAYFNIC